MLQGTPLTLGKEYEIRTREIERAVRRGVKLLDKSHPNWRSKVSLEDLNLLSSERCIIGQVFGSYYQARLVLGLSQDAGIYYGFDVPIADRWTKGSYKRRRNHYDRLRDAWINELGEGGE